MNQQLTDLIDSIIATDPFPTSWAWQDDDGVGYLDCSAIDQGVYRLELGDGDESVQVDVTADVLRQIHQKITVQLAVIARRQSA